MYVSAGSLILLGYVIYTIVSNYIEKIKELEKADRYQEGVKAGYAEYEAKIGTLEQVEALVEEVKQLRAERAQIIGDLTQ